MDPACNEQIDAEKTARCRGVLVASELLTLLLIILMQRNLLIVGGCS